jgi:hypothetical protein
MSRTKTIAGLAVAFLIASAFLVAAHDTPKTFEVANHPAISSDAGPRAAARTSLAQLTAAATSSTEAAPVGAPALSENAYDFNNPDGIPGFGTLPPAYDPAPVMPRIGSR